MDVKRTLENLLRHGVGLIVLGSILLSYLPEEEEADRARMIVTATRRRTADTSRDAIAR